MGPLIIYSGRDPSGRLWIWLCMSLVFLALLIHRSSLIYELTPDRLTAYSWWGLGLPEKISLKSLDQAVVMRSLSMNLVGCGHIYLSSSRSDEAGLTILAQVKAEKLADELRALSEAAKRAHESIEPGHWQENQQDQQDQQDH
ncbi:MAG: hypothetical protein LBE31_02010 [Deltaproteobacteria bacterium]|jgi:hypothetical protein|nr:hypothetical protein [Deltaproteobacteria bacterium]